MEIARQRRSGFCTENEILQARALVGGSNKREVYEVNKEKWGIFTLIMTLSFNSASTFKCFYNGFKQTFISPPYIAQIIYINILHIFSHTLHRIFWTHQKINKISYTIGRNICPFSPAISRLTKRIPRNFPKLLL